MYSLEPPLKYIQSMFYSIYVLQQLHVYTPVKLILDLLFNGGVLLWVDV